MKPMLSNLNEALTYQLESMYDAEKMMQKSLPRFAKFMSSPDLQLEINSYAESSSDKRTKLKRIFSYLLAGPFGRVNMVMFELLKDARGLSRKTVRSPLRDRMFIAGLQCIVDQKIVVYQSAKVFAEELSLDAVVDLLEEILQWEKEVRKRLAEMSLALANGKELEVA